MDATSIKIKAVSRPSNLSRKVITPKPLNLKVSAIKLKKKVGVPAQPYSLQDEDFDPRPFSFLENDPVTPGFEPITPFEITPPNSAGGTEEDDGFNDNDSDIIDSPGPTADFHNNRIRKALGKEVEADSYEEERLRQEEAEYVARNLGFSQAQPSNYRGLMLKKSSKKPSKQSLRHRESRETMFSEDSVISDESNPTPKHNSRFSMSTATDMDPTTPFMDTGFEDHDYFDNSKTPQANSSRNLLFRSTAPASATRTKFVSTELVMPMPQHPTPLSPTMERFLSKMSEVITSPLSATFPEEVTGIAPDPATPAQPSKTEFKIPSHVIDVNLVSVVAMDFSPQQMIDISGNAALVQQECDPIAEPKQSSGSNMQQIMYIIPILLNDPASFCACDKAHVESDSASVASATRSAIHPSNILRFENVIVQMRLAPRPRIRRHGWTFLNIGIPTRIVVGILDHLEKELVSVGKCKMVLHGDYYWIYTPVRAFTKIYKREYITSPKGLGAPSRTNSKTPKTVADLDALQEEDEDDDDSVIDDSGDEEEEERQTIYKELPDSRFYSLLETRSLSVDLYTEIYAKSTAEFPFDSPSQGDFSLGFSIREIIVTAESNVRGPDWSHVKSQRSKCLARGHPADMISPISGVNRSVVGSPFNPGSVNTHAINAWNSNVTTGSIRSVSNLGNPIDRWDPNSTPVNRTDPNATPVARSIANGSVVNDYASMARYGSRGATATPGACSHCGSHVPDGVASPISTSATSPIINHGRFDKRSNSSLSTSYRSQSLNRIREDGRQSSRGYKVVENDSHHSRTNSRSRNDDARSGSKVRSRSQLSRRDHKDGRQSAGRRRDDRSQSRDRTIERDAASTPKAPQTTSTTYDSDNWVVKDKSNPVIEEATPEKSRKRWGRKKKYVD